MTIDEFGNTINNNECICIGISYSKKIFTNEFRNLKDYHKCSRKVDEIKNELYNSNFNKKEMEEIIKSVLLQIQNEK